MRRKEGDAKGNFCCACRSPDRLCAHLGRVLRSAETILVSGQCEFSRIDLRLATRQQIREHAPRPARHGPAERAMPGVEIEVGITGYSDHGRTVGSHWPQAAPEGGVLKPAAAREQIGQRMIERCLPRWMKLARIA